jgi:hypothetical protein
LRFIKYQQEVERVPLVIGEHSIGDRTYDFNTFVEKGFATSRNVNISKLYIAIQANRIPHGVDCIDRKNIKTEGFLIKKEETKICIKMFACHLERNRNTVAISQKILYLMSAGLNYAPECLDNPNLKFQNLNILEFDVRGLCICENIKLHMNECKMAKRNLNYLWNWLVLIGCVVLMFVFILLGIYFLKE